MNMSKKSSCKYWEELPKCLKFLKNTSFNTKRAYFQSISKYEMFHNMSISELVCEAMDEQDRNVPTHRLKIIERIEEFQEFLIGEGFVFGTIKNHISKIKSIYYRNRVDIPYIDSLNPKVTKRREYIEFKDILTKEEIKEALTHMGVRSQARALVMAQGGLSNEECEHLTLRAFIDENKKYHQCEKDEDALVWLSNPDHPIIWVTKLIRWKTKKPYYALIGPEAVNKIAEAKLYEKGLPKYKGVIPNKLLSENKESFARICREVNKICGFGLVAEESKFRSHNLRRFNATYISGSVLSYEENVTISQINEMQGRGKTSTEDTYIKSNPTKQKLLYAKVMNNVSLYNEYSYKLVDGDVIISVRDMASENEKLREEIKELSTLIQEKKKSSEKVNMLREELGDDAFKELINEILSTS